MILKTMSKIASGVALLEEVVRSKPLFNREARFSVGSLTKIARFRFTQMGESVHCRGSNDRFRTACQRQQPTPERTSVTLASRQSNNAS